MPRSNAFRRSTSVKPAPSVPRSRTVVKPWSSAMRAAAAARIALDHGFTTVRDLGTEGAGFTDVDLRKAFDRGIVPGPRVFAAGPAMTPTGRYPLLGFSWERKMPDGVLKLSLIHISE